MDRRTLLASGGLAISSVTAGGVIRGIDLAGRVQEDDGSDDWPETFFAPYHYLPIEPDTPLSRWCEEAGTEYLHVGFILADSNGRPTWNGDSDHVVGESSFDDAIASFQDEGGRVIISFGGGAGSYLPEAFQNPRELADVFERIADEYGVTFFDIDEEKPDRDVFDRRNRALALLQDRRPEMKVTYTLPADPYGIADLAPLDSAIAHGVDVEIINPMTMNYGSLRPSADRCIWTLNGIHDQLSWRYRELTDDEVWSKIGATPMIGENDVGGAFYPGDAEQLLSFAEEMGMRMVSFWSVERDNPGPEGEVSSEHSGIEQDEFEFSQIFNDHNP